MRTLLVTGPGGSGRTTLAAAAALAAARRGTRTLVLSTDPVDSLGAALGRPVGRTPVAVEEGLTALRPDTAEDFRGELLGLQGRASAALDLLGAQRLDGEELTPLPGAREISLLKAVRAALGEGGPDLLVVDLPPVVEAVSLLALPEQLRRYLARLLPPERQAARALRPVLGRLAGVPLPADALYATAARWDRQLAEIQGLLADPGTGVLLVAEPGPAAAESVRTALAGLALHRLAVTGLAANRLLPPEADGPWTQALAAQQHKTLGEWQGSGLWPGAPFVHQVPHLGRDPQGDGDLAAFALPGESEPVAPGAWTVRDRLSEDGLLLWRIPLPGAVREELDLVRRGAELVLTVGPFRRIVPLPSALTRCRVAGAALRDGTLELRFAPDPELWPRQG